MKTSIFLLPALIRSLVASSTPSTSDETRYPHYQSASFDDGSYGAYPNRSYITVPHLTAPRLNILQSSPRCDDGLYTMISLRGDKVMLQGQSPMIFDGRGELVWMNPVYGETFGLGVQRYKGVDYLTFWQGDDSVGGHGEGYYFMLDEQYREAYRITAGEGKPGDLHEFRITADGTALLTQYLMKEVDVTWGRSYIGAGGRRIARKGYIWDSVVQEINIETNEIIFEWHASEHFKISESDFPAGNAGLSQKRAYDFFHINSVDKDADGNYLISSRYYQGLTYIDGKTGDIVWQLGGRHNSFKDLSSGAATKFAWQHDATWNADHTGVTLFDNGARYGLKPTASSSRGVHITLDLQAMTAELKRSYRNPQKIISASQGSMQVLPSGNVLLGFGYNAAWTEYSEDGEVLCDVHVGSKKTFNTGAVQTYKVHKHPWVGKPDTLPEIAVQDGNVFMSWNGATEVRRWKVQGKKQDAADMVDVVVVDRTGFETSAEFDWATWCELRVVAIDGKGNELGVSDTVETDCVANDESEEGDTADRLADWLFGGESDDVSPTTITTLQLIGLVGASIGVWELWRRRVHRRGYYMAVKTIWSDV